MKNIFKGLILISLIAAVSACGAKEPEQSESSEASIESSEVTPRSETSTISSEASASSITPSSDAHQIRTDELYTDSGLSIKFKAQGARIDKITWGGKQIAKDGFVVGRCANRIKNGKFTIDGTEYQAQINANPHSLHGGGSSWQGPFATSNWTKVSQTFDTITYSIHSADGAQGYPGNMDMTVKYTLSQEGELSIEYTATTDKATLCNPTNHLFIAMNGNTSYDNIKLQINADNYTPLNNQIPTGEIASVEGTQFDYRTERAFDKSKSYDDNLCLNGEGYRKVATMKGETLGVKIDVFTDRPGLQLYKDNNGNICLETQMYPDAINQANFEDPILRPNEQFYSKTSYVFSSLE